jgi:methyl-accepting chemotaxis protein
MAKFHSRILLTHKIMAIGAVGVFGILVMGAIYLIGASIQERHREVAEGAQATSSLAKDLYVELLDSRRAEKDFLLRNDMKYVDRHKKLDQAVRDDIDRLRGQAVAAHFDDLVQKIDTIRNGFQVYSTHFAAIVAAKQKLGLDENSGLEGALRGSVHAIESKLNEFKEPRLQVTMLMMRRHEKDFMLRREPKYGDDIKKRAAEFLAGLDHTDIPAAAKDDLKQKLATYQRDFLAWMDAALTLANEQRLTSDAFGTIEPTIEAMLGTANETYGKAESANRISRADTKLQMELAILFVAVAVFALAFMIGRSVSRPITSLTDLMGRLAHGDNNVEVQGAGRSDEIGRMAAAVLVFRDAAIEKLRLEGQTAEQRRQTEEERRRNEEAARRAAEEQARVVDLLGGGLKSLSEGDLTFRLTDGFSETYQQIKDDFNAATARLQETIQAIAAAAREVAGASSEISGGTTDLSQRTEEQAASLEETSASMEQISSTVKKNAENAQQANQLTAGTREVADRGGAVVAEAVSAMARIEESSRKISDIISVIDEIARQTNLLALNAAVEAARAGEAGRGFAVVASEVRSLAQRSSQAAKDIKELITNSSGQVQEGVELVNRAGASLTEIVESIEKVAEIVADIAAASAEQSTGIDQVNSALSQMDEVTQQNSALVEQCAAAAKALEQQSQEMDQQVSMFRLGDAMSIGNAPQVVVLKRPAAETAKPRMARATTERSTAVSKQSPAPKRGVVGRMQAALATAFKPESGWKEF